MAAELEKSAGKTHPSRSFHACAQSCAGVHVGTPNDWNNLLNSCQAALDIRSILQQLINCKVDWYPRVFEDILATWDSPGLEFCAQRIRSTIDIKESKSQGRYVIINGCHRALDELKYHFQGMNDFLNQVALEQGNQLSLKMNQCIADVSKMDLKVISRSDDFAV
eukprot:SAG31_NODE_1558_length_7885_cov_2.567300_6_plen_165_part_00